MSNIATCDDCGGPAWWTVGPFGDVFYICQAPCDGFLQVEMFSDSGAPLADEPIVPQVDRSGSVSALVAVAVMLRDYKTQGLCSCDLLF